MRPGRTSCPSRAVHYPPLSEQPHMRQIIGNMSVCTNKEFQFQLSERFESMYSLPSLIIMVCCVRPKLGQTLQSLTSVKSNMQSK